MPSYPKPLKKFNVPLIKKNIEVKMFQGGRIEKLTKIPLFKKLKKLLKKLVRYIPALDKMHRFIVRWLLKKKPYLFVCIFYLPIITKKLKSTNHKKLLELENSL